jgi:hypothetical protein
MLVKLRDNIWLGDKDAFVDIADLKKEGITTLVVVSDELNAPAGAEAGIKVFKVGLVSGPNYGHVKDLACHIPKYMSQNGEIVLVQGVTGLVRGAFVAARAICEIENKSIFEIFQEIKELVPNLNLSKVYL